MKNYIGKRRRENRIDLILIAIPILGFIILAVAFPSHPAYAISAPEPVVSHTPQFNPADMYLLDMPTVTSLGRYWITGYNPNSSVQCGKEPGDADIGIGANNKRIIPGEHIAMKGIAFGTRVYIEGLGLYTVEDRGVGGSVIDVACEDDEACYAITSSERLTAYEVTP